MNLRSTSIRALVAGSAACALTLGLAQPAMAETEPSPPADSAQLEALDRGLVAVSTAEGVFLSWRLLKSEAGPATATGVSSSSFAVFRDGERIATVDDSTNYADRDGTASSIYTVAPAWNDVVGEQSAEVSAWSAGYYDLPLQKPADGDHPHRRSLHLLGERRLGRRCRRRRRLRVRREVGSVQLEGRLAEGLHRHRLRRHLRVRRHAAQPHRPRRQHPRGRPLHAVHGLRLRRRRPLRDHAEDCARHEVDPLQRRRLRRLLDRHHDARGGPRRRVQAPPTTTA